LYQAINAVIIPNTPPALVNPFGDFCPISSWKKQPSVSKRNVTVKKPNNAIIPPFDRNVAKNNRNVTIKKKEENLARMIHDMQEDVLCVYLQIVQPNKNIPTEEIKLKYFNQMIYYIVLNFI
jgi:hypothetical protein